MNMAQSRSRLHFTSIVAFEMSKIIIVLQFMMWTLTSGQLLGSSNVQIALESFSKLCNFIQLAHEPSDVTHCGFTVPINELMAAFPSSKLLISNEVVECINKTLSNFEGRVTIIVAVSIMDDIFRSIKMINSFYIGNPHRAPEVHLYLVWPLEGIGPAWARNAKEILELQLHNAPLNSNFYVIRSSNNELDVWEFYKAREKVVFEQFSPLKPAELTRYVKRRGNFHGATLKGIVQDGGYSDATLAVIFERVNGSSRVAGGIAIDMFQVMGSVLNFTIAYTMGKGWTQLADNGSVIGMGSQLLSFEGDVQVSYSELLLYRVQTFAASFPVNTRRLAAFIAKPELSDYRNILILSFRPNLWVALIVSLIATCLCCSIVILVQRHINCNTESNERIMDAIVWIIAANCQQAWPGLMRSLALQMIALVTLVVSMLCYTVYAASIISIFSVENNPLKSIDDLVEYGYEFYGNRFSFKALEYVSRQASRNGYQPSSRDIEINEALTVLNTSRAAFLSVQTTFFGIAAVYQDFRELCTWISAVPFKNDSQIDTMYFRKFDPVRKFINYHQVRWREFGLLHHFRDPSDHRLINHCDPPKRVPRSLSFRNLQGAHVILIVGFIASGLLFIMERLILNNSRVGDQYRV